MCYWRERTLCSRVSSVKTVAEIEATLPEMPTEDLHRLEVVIHGIYRKRHERVIYDDAYGVWLGRPDLGCGRSLRRS
jgi:hypothetical protein